MSTEARETSTIVVVTLETICHTGDEVMRASETFQRIAAGLAMDGIDTRIDLTNVKAQEEQ